MSQEQAHRDIKQSWWKFKLGTYWYKWH